MRILKSKAIRVCLALVFGFVFAILILVVAISSIRGIATHRYYAKALVEIERMARDEPWMRSQVESMAHQADSDDAWLSPHLVRMKSGEWVVCSSMCSKADWKIQDTFVCKASNGNWYDSTHHFCIGMYVLRMHGQPESLQEFIDNYGLRKIDG